MHYDNKNKKQIKTYFPLAFYFLMIIFLVSMKGDNITDDATPVKLSIYFTIDTYVITQKEIQTPCVVSRQERPDNERLS